MAAEPIPLLVIDTSTDQPAVGLLASDGRLEIATPRSTRKHGRDLVPCIWNLLKAQGLRASGLRVVAVGLGPGSYTGLRIGLTAARTLAYATGADLVGFDSLEGWARAAPAEALHVHAVADAQRGDVYGADFAREAPGTPLKLVSASRIEPLTAWSRRLDGARAGPGLGVVVGPGMDSPRSLAAVPPGLVASPPADDRARTRALLDLAREIWLGGGRADLWTVEPLYLRRSSAEDLWDARSRSSGTGHGG